MPAKRKPTGTDQDLNLATLSPLFVDETKAREFLESKRWPNGPVCRHCQCTEVYRLTAKPGSKRPGRPGLLKCKRCRKQFTVRIGTIFEESLIPLHKWLMAIHLMTSSKKGISSHQIARELGITVKSAWFLTHRIREAMRQEPMKGMLKGTIEADETYVGPRRPRNPSAEGKRRKRDSKFPVMALVERDGRAYATPIDGATAPNLRTEIEKTVDLNSTLMTDEWRCYTIIGREFTGGHHKINHRRKEYVRRTPNGDCSFESSLS